VPEGQGQDLHRAEQAARAALRTDPATADLAEARFTPVPGGLSNHAWHVVTDHAGEYFVRLARRYGEQLGADHAAECRVLEVTWRAGLSPPIVRCDPAARLLVTVWIDAPHVGQPLRSPTALSLVAQALATLHDLPVPRGLRTVRFDEQARALATAVPPDAVAGALALRAREVFARLRAADTSPVLCHHDLNPLNLLRDRDGRLWLVDWEYAGLGDPAIDLASFASQHGLGARQRTCLLDGYRRAGRTVVPARFDLARWAFDYVQWAWYRAALARPDAGLERALVEGRVARLAVSLRRRATGLLRCNNAGFAN
jgi:thiamine kinase